MVWATLTSETFSGADSGVYLYFCDSLQLVYAGQIGVVMYLDKKKSNTVWSAQTKRLLFPYKASSVLKLCQGVVQETGSNLLIMAEHIYETCALPMQEYFSNLKFLKINFFNLLSVDCLNYFTPTHFSCPQKKEMSEFPTVCKVRALSLFSANRLASHPVDAWICVFILHHLLNILFILQKCNIWGSYFTSMSGERLSCFFRVVSLAAYYPNRKSLVLK